MKNLITFLILFFSSLDLSAQIMTTKIATPKIDDKIQTPPSGKQPYDSSKNFVGKDVYSLIGETLYVLPRPKNLQKYGYDNFLLDYKIDKLERPNGKPNVYKCCDGYNSQYSELKEQSFTVLDVIEHPKMGDRSGLYNTNYFFKLVQNASKDTVYLEYDSKYSSRFDHIVVMGFFTKQKTASIGKEFIIMGKNWRETVYNEHKPLYDMVTGKEVKLVRGSVWKVVDLIVEEEYFTLSYVIQNSSGNKLTLNMRSAHDSQFLRRVFEKSKVDYIIQDYPHYWEKIMESKVVVGMTEEMVRLSFGDPDKINHSSYGTQWVYGSQYLYFEKGKLKAFN